MATCKLSEGEARLLVAVFFHLNPYYEQAKAKHTSVADEMNNADEEIFDVYYGLLKKALIGRLSEREYKVIAQRYGIFPYAKRRTLEEIGREFGVTRERIRQVEAKALKKIHQYMTELNDEETAKVVYNLQADVQEHLMDAVRARVAEDSALAEMYEHCWSVGTDAINKLKIQRRIRRHREGTE